MTADTTDQYRLRYYRGPLRFVEPTSDSDARGPRIEDADGNVIASLLWSCHPAEETSAAEQETYVLGRAMAASLDLLSSLKELGDWVAGGLQASDEAWPDAKCLEHTEQIAGRARDAVDKAEGRL